MLHYRLFFLLLHSYHSFRHGYCSVSHTPPLDAAILLKESLMDTFFTIVCLVSQTVCLGLVIYVIRGWRKRMQNASARMPDRSEQVEL